MGERLPHHLKTGPHGGSIDAPVDARFGASVPALATLFGRGYAGVVDAVVRRDGPDLRAAYDVMRSGSVWSSTGGRKGCKGYAVLNPNEAAQLDAYIAALATEFDGAPPPPPPPPPPPGDVLFEDHFIGVAGSKPDPAKWEIVTTPGADWDDWCRVKPENVFLDGKGNLVLRSKPDTPGPNGIAFSGSIVATYGYDTGYPAGRILSQWPVPFRWESRWRMPPVDGSHCSAGWVQQLDKPKGEHIFEIDCGESHSTDPYHTDIFQHDWINGVEQHLAGGQVAPSSNWRENFHTIACEVRADRVDYFLDGVKVKTFYGVSGKYGAVLHNPISRHPWQNGGKMPDPASPGPWDMLVDYVRVTSLV